jgi:hypothetical protein
MTCLLRCCAVSSRRNWSTFQRCFLPPSSGSVFLRGTKCAWPRGHLPTGALNLHDLGWTLVQKWSKTQQSPMTTQQPRPTCCGVKNTFRMSVYSKEYTFTFLLWSIRVKRKDMDRSSRQIFENLFVVSARRNWGPSWNRQTEQLIVCNGTRNRYKSHTSPF